LDLERAVVFYLDGVLHLSRPQNDLRRFGRLTEGIAVDAGAPAPAGVRPLRLLGAFSRHPSVEEVNRTRREFAARLASTGSDGPLRRLLAPGYEQALSYRALLARALAAFAQRPGDGHLAIVLGPDQSRMVVPLAAGLDEILPPPDKQRGFAFATFPVEAVSPAMRDRLAWTVFVPADGFAPASAAGVDVCDLRDAAPQADPVTDAATKLLDRGAATVETFARWLAERLAGPVSKLPPEFWQRLNLRLVTGGELGRVPAGMMANLLDWRILDLNGFLGFWNAVGSDDAGAAVRDETIRKVARWASACPPVLGWLVHPDVLNAETAPAVAKALDEAFARLAETETR
ncbi:MAG: hypothetical protein ACYS5V_08705, partial [Planctomycetota bacterium]